jgi:hypothetical protein
MISRSVFLLRFLTFLFAASGSLGAFAQKQEFGNRFEGAFLNNGNDEFKVIGVLRAPVEFAPSELIWVKFFLPPGKVPGSGVQIESQELIDLHAYFMQSKSFPLTADTWNRFGPWPAKDVLVPQQIESTNISVTASYVDDAGTRIYLPALVRGDALSPSNSYTFQFRVASNIHSLKKFLIGTDGKVTNLPTSECTFAPTCILYDSGTSHSVVIDMSAYSEGLYRLHLEGSVPGKTDSVTRTITFYHKGS